MSKKDLDIKKMGLFNGASGATQAEPPVQAEQQPQPVQAEPEQAEPQPENNILDTVDNEELKEALLKRAAKPKVGRPKKGTVKAKPTKPDYTSVTIIANAEKYAKLKEVADRARLTMKDVLEAAMDLAIEAYEAKNGPIVVEERKVDNAKDLFI